jgi:hypothetical protein
LKDGLVAAVLATGVVTAAEGIRFSHLAPSGAIPLADGDHPMPDAPPEAARLKRRLNILGLVTVTAEAGLVAVNAALSQEGFRRPPSRRLKGLLGRRPSSSR